ncbi:MAG: hypothetical protein MJZ26_06680 [Fibrobacter sp.]|nr:hypothetical protein [Fibrobacter sp.]
MSAKITTKDQIIMSVNAQMELGFQEWALINVLLGKSYADELDEWRRDFDVVDDNVSKILNRKSRELPNIKKVSKIWG